MVSTDPNVERDLSSTACLSNVFSVSPDLIESSSLWISVGNFFAGVMVFGDPFVCPGASLQVGMGGLGATVTVSFPS